MSRITVVGDCLLDRDVTGSADRVMPDAPAVVLDEDDVTSRPGGAGLAATLAAADGHDVTLVTGLAADEAGADLRRLLAAVGVTVVDLGSRAATAEKIRLRAGGRSLLRWDRGARALPSDLGGWTPAAEDAMRAADAILVSCYGRGTTGHDGVRTALGRVAGAVPVVWDPHPRGADPVPGTAVATPNRAEAARAVPDVDGSGLDAVTRRARELARRWQARGCAVTLGADGALLAMGEGLPLVVPAPAVPQGTADACGAGDRFASALAAALGQGCLPSEALGRAVHAATAFVAAGGAAAVRITHGAGDGAADAIDLALQPPDHVDAFALAERVRAEGGTVVATGGCFDLVHSGHAQLLRSARALGDCLIVCLNSDESVRRLKGADRPIVGQHDRADLLRAFGCVDAVAIFDDDTPVPLLRRLRPHIFAKGGDYASARIPEADALAEWGGQAVTLPYLDGRSTTRLLQEVQTRANDR